MSTIKYKMNTPIAADPNNARAVVDEANDGEKAVPVELVLKSADDSTFDQVNDTNGLPVKVTGSNATDAVAVTPSDSVDLVKVTKGIYVGGSGDLKVTLFSGATVTFGGLSSGVIHPIAAKRVFATGTTATAILGVY